MDRDDDWAVRRLFEAVGQTSDSVVFDERLFNGPLATLTGEAG